jgi:hypothetical protein
MVLGGTPLCRGLGFRFETARHGPAAGFPYPVGKDEVFETHHPHYFGGSIDDAVDDVIERKWGAGGCVGGMRPLERSDNPRSVNSPGDSRP